MAADVIGAAIDAGSNTVHLLVGRTVISPAPDGAISIEPLRDVSEFAGLGTIVDRDGWLGPDAAGLLIATLTRQIEEARALGATTFLLMGTEPFRRAADASAVSQRVLGATGQPLHVLSHLEEGLLCVLALTGGRPVEEPTLVVDIGGGSTECILVGPAGIDAVNVVAVGSNRLVDALVRRDPPRKRELEALRAEALVHAAGLPDAPPARLVFMGGSATNLLKLDQPSLATRTLDRGALERIAEILRSTPSAELSARYRVNPRRATLLSGGAAIVAAVMERYGCRTADVSSLSLREGALIARATEGEPWRGRLPSLMGPRVPLG